MKMEVNLKKILPSISENQNTSFTLKIVSLDREPKIRDRESKSLSLLLPGVKHPGQRTGKYLSTFPGTFQGEVAWRQLKCKGAPYAAALRGDSRRACAELLSIPHDDGPLFRA